MTSIVGITALQELRKFKGFENAVIAGGFVRDSLMGGTIKDLDIFIPVASVYEFEGLVTSHFKVLQESKGIDITVPERDIEVWMDNRKKLGDKNIFSLYNFHLDTKTLTYKVTSRNLPPPVYDKKIGSFTDLEYVSRKEDQVYRQMSPSYSGHFNGKYMGFLDVDLCAYVYTPNVDFENQPVWDDFGTKLVSEFSYNIDKVYFDGDNTIQTKEFQHDMKYSEATLVQLNDLSALPHAMNKFFRLKEKYPQLMFRSTVLEIKKEEDNSHKKANFKEQYGWSNTSSTAPGGIQFINFPNG